uniref:C2 NT-type domain-containing protein n=1 Tax=Glossina pallidipes TaxID=7398 RepID=A0A1A9Z0I9_GLOPL
MAFMMKKKKYRFNVEVQLQDLDNVALMNEVLFAIFRLLAGGSFQEYSSRMSANASTGVLSPCYLRISIRKGMKGGRSYYKLGFIGLNLAEYAGAGLISRRCLLEGSTPNLKSKRKSSGEDWLQQARRMSFNYDIYEKYVNTNIQTPLHQSDHSTSQPTIQPANHPPTINTKYQENTTSCVIAVKMFNENMSANL